MSPRGHRRARGLTTTVMITSLGSMRNAGRGREWQPYADIQLNFAGSGPKAGGGIRRFEAAS
jgi:hypothetical protein